MILCWKRDNLLYNIQDVMRDVVLIADCFSSVVCLFAILIYLIVSLKE